MLPTRSTVSPTPDGYPISRSVNRRMLEAAPIGGPLFAHHNCEGLRKVSRLPLGTYATRLLAQALSLRFNHEGFAMDISSIAKPPRSPSSRTQAAVLMAG